MLIWWAGCLSDRETFEKCEINSGVNSRGFVAPDLVTAGVLFNFYKRNERIDILVSLV